MKKLVILCAVILLASLPVVLVVGCQQQPTPEPTPPPPPPPPSPTPETLTYTNSEYGFSVEYPKDWDVLEDFMESVVFLAGPQVLEGAFMVNINLATEQLPKDMTHNDFAKMVELNTKRQVTDYNKVDEYSTEIGGQPAIVFTCTCTFEFEEKEYVLKDVCAVFIKDNIGYIITYDVPAESHDDYLDCFDLMINSFKFE